MVNAVIGANEEVLQFRNYDVLRRDLGFISMVEMKRYINSRMFEPFSTQYATECIYPQLKFPAGKFEDNLNQARFY